MKTRYFILALGLLAAVSCREKINPVVEDFDLIQVTSGADLAFKAIGGEGSISFAPVNGTLTAESMQSWCRILSVDSNKITVHVDEYGGLESRYAKIVMRVGDAEAVTVVHQYGIIVRAFEAHDVTIKNPARDVAFYYEANESLVRADIDVDWATVIVEPDSLRIRVSENIDKDYREAHVNWSFGEMSGRFTLVQFDLADAGLLGGWTFSAVNAANGRAFSYYPLDAELSQEGENKYVLTVTKQSGNVTVDYRITGVTFDSKCLMIPLGNWIGTHAPNNNTTYQVFPLVANGTGSTTYENAVHEGSLPLLLNKEDGVWTARVNGEPFGDKVFRFEFWSSKEHSGSSQSRTAIKDIVMTKNL